MVRVVVAGRVWNSIRIVSRMDVDVKERIEAEFVEASTRRGEMKSIWERIQQGKHEQLREKKKKKKKRRAVRVWVTGVRGCGSGERQRERDRERMRERE